MDLESKNDTLEDLQTESNFKQDFFVGLDIGTTKIVCLVGKKDQYGKLEILGDGVTLFSTENAIQRGGDLGEIKVSSIELVNDQEETMLELSTKMGKSGLIRAFDSDRNVVFTSIKEEGAKSISSDSIIVKSITLVNKDDKITAEISNNKDGYGEIRFYGNEDSERLHLGVNSDQNGFIRTFNGAGNQAVNLGLISDGYGIETFNNMGDIAATFGTSNKNNGFVRRAFWD